MAIANIELMEAPFANRDNTHSNICGPFPVVENGYALPLEGPGLGIEFDEEAAANTPFKPKQMPNLNAIDGSIRDW